MNIDELKHTHKHYQANVEEWRMFKAAYNGTKSLIDWGALKRNNREEDVDFEARKKSAYGFNYTSRIVAIINSYIFQKPSGNDYGALADDDFFQLFLQDADLQGKTFNTLINDNQKWASVFGHMGILVDKPLVDGIRTVAQDLEDMIYPFVTTYTPLNILDWETTRINGRNVLSFIKLMDDDDIYRLWWRDRWETWGVNDGTAKLIDAGDNDLGVIPFVFMTNEDSGVRFIGKSDIKEISRMDISILRRLSSSEEVFNLASFPMLMKPYLPPGQKEDDTVGPANVIEFDHRSPESKPEWLKTAIAEPIKAVMDWIDGLIQEMYKSINANGLNTTSGQVKSGESLQREFQSLNAFLSKKAKLTVMATESRVIYFWLMWQDRLDLFDGVTIDRPTNYDITSLTDELDNYTVAKTLVNSETFHKNMQKVVARKTLPNTNPDDEVAINSEIDEGSPVFDMAAADDAQAEIDNA